jgi:tetratricopeptide (TPR) repeat protein
MSTQPAELLKAARLLSLGEPFLAERTATAGLRRYPDNGRLLQVRGIARHYLFHLGPAIADLEAAMTLVPLDPLGIWCLADAYESQKRFDLTRHLARWLIGRRDCPPRLFPRLAKMLARLGEDELALQAWEECDRREPDQAETLFEMGYLMNRLGYSPAAIISRLKRAAQLDPKHAGYQAQLGLVQIASGRTDEGRQILIDLAPGKVACPHLATRIARGLEEAHRVDLASQWWKRSIELVRDPGYQPE